MYRVSIITPSGLMEYTGKTLRNTWDETVGRIEGMLTLFNAVNIKSDQKLHTLSFPIHRAIIEYIEEDEGNSK